MAEETTVEKLTEERRELDVRIREQKVLAHQREHLLPALELKEERLIVQIADLEHERDEVQAAILHITTGTPTNYRLRAKPVRKAKE